MSHGREALLLPALRSNLHTELQHEEASQLTQSKYFLFLVFSTINQSPRYFLSVIVISIESSLFL